MPEDKAAAAASPFESQDMRSDISQLKNDVSAINVRLASVEPRLAVAEKLQWGILLGIIGLFIKSFLG